MNQGKKIILRPYKLSELAALYEMNRNTFRTNFVKPLEHKLGRRKGHYYTVGQVKLIFEYCTPPDGYVLVENC